MADSAQVAVSTPLGGALSSTTRRGRSPGASNRPDGSPTCNELESAAGPDQNTFAWALLSKKLQAESLERETQLAGLTAYVQSAITSLHSRIDVLHAAVSASAGEDVRGLLTKLQTVQKAHEDEVRELKSTIDELRHGQSKNNQATTRSMDELTEVVGQMSKMLLERVTAVEEQQRIAEEDRAGVSLSPRLSAASQGRPLQQGVGMPVAAPTAPGPIELRPEPATVLVHAEMPTSLPTSPAEARHPVRTNESTTTIATDIGRVPSQPALSTEKTWMLPGPAASPVPAEKGVAPALRPASPLRQQSHDPRFQRVPVQGHPPLPGGQSISADSSAKAMSIPTGMVGNPMSITANPPPSLPPTSGFAPASRMVRANSPSFASADWAGAGPVVRPGNSSGFLGKSVSPAPGWGSMPIRMDHQPMPGPMQPQVPGGHRFVSPPPQSFEARGPPRDFYPGGGLPMFGGPMPAGLSPPAALGVRPMASPPQVLSARQPCPCRAGAASPSYAAGVSPIRYQR